MARIDRNRYRARFGFTLVELLVVLVILGMLMGLLTPAILSARARARQMECANHLQTLAKATLAYEVNKEQFPGWANRIRVGSNDRFGTWATVLLPELNRNDLWEQWRTQATLGDSAEVNVAVFICPSDNPARKMPLSYVANCGQQDGGATGLGDPKNNIPPDWKANGIFFRHFSPNGSDFKDVKMKAADIKDGASVTLLYSENVQGGNWGYLETTQDQSVTREAETGMVWWVNPDDQNAEPGVLPINQVGSAYTLDTPRAELTDQDSFEYSRPSSLHPQGVNAAFCDGHVQFLNEGIDLLVYTKLMAPDNANTKYAGDKDKTPMPEEYRKGSISAEDLQ